MDRKDLYTYITILALLIIIVIMVLKSNNKQKIDNYKGDPYSFHPLAPTKPNFNEGYKSYENNFYNIKDAYDFHKLGPRNNNCNINEEYSYDYSTLKDGYNFHPLALTTLEEAQLPSRCYEPYTESKCKNFDQNNDYNFYSFHPLAPTVATGPPLPPEPVKIPCYF